MTQREARLARQLIDAARSERPPASLEQRLLQLDPERLELAAHAQAANRSSRALARAARQAARAAASLGARLASRPRAPLGAGLIAVASLGSLALVVWNMAERAPAPLISAERRSPPVSAPVPFASPSAARPARTEPLPATSEGPAEHPSSPSSPERGAVDERSPARRRAPEPSLPPVANAAAAKAPATAASPVADAAPAAAGSPGTLAPELALLIDARAALRSGAGRRALVLLDRYDESRANPALDAEAALLRIEGLSLIGERERAAQLAERFVREHPDDALADRARRFAPRAAPVDDP